MAVALIGNLLQYGILEVAGAKAHNGQEYTALPFFFDQLHQFVIARDTNVEVTIGCQDDPVVTLLQKILAGNRICEPETGGTRRRPSRLQTIDRVKNRSFLVTPRRRQTQTHGAVVGHERHPVVPA